MQHTAQTDYLAVISTGCGIGSWARDKDKATAISNVTRRFYYDWRTMIEGGLDGKEIVVEVIDVNGHDTVSWDSQGFYGNGGKIERPIEQVKHAYPQKKARRRH